MTKSIFGGSFAGTSNFGGTSLTSGGIYDGFICSLDEDGNLVWIKQLSSTGDNSIYDVNLLDDGSSIISGYFSDTTNFSGTNVTSSGETDILIAKLDSNGSISWLKNFGGTGRDISNSSSVFSDNSIIISGYFKDTVSFGSTTLSSFGDGDYDGDIFIAKLDSTGNTVWAKNFGGSEGDSASDIQTLDDGSSIVSGWFRDSASFGSTTLTSNGSTDAFFTKLDSNGSVSWIKQFGGIGLDVIYGISSFNNNFLIGGVFENTISFGDINLTSSGGYDSFYAKLDSNGNTVWAKNFGGIGNDGGYDIQPLSDGSSIISGNFRNNVTFGGTTLTSAGDADGFVAKLDSNGSVIWVKQFGGTGLDSLDGITIESDNSYLVSGQFWDTVNRAGTSVTGSGSLDGI